MRSSRVLPAVCAGLLVLAGCEQGTELATDPVPVDVTAPQMDPEMAATASAEAEAARQQRATRRVGLSGTLVAADLPSLEIREVSALFDAHPADEGLVVTASATVSVQSRQSEDASDGASSDGDQSDEDAEGDRYPRPVAAVVPLWEAGSVVCDAAEADEALAAAVAPLGDGAGCHGIVPPLGVSGDTGSRGPSSLGAVEQNPDVSGEAPLPVDLEGADSGLTVSLADPDGWALVTPLQVDTPAATHVYTAARCSLVESALRVSEPAGSEPAGSESVESADAATILSTVELADCG